MRQPCIYINKRIYTKGVTKMTNKNNKITVYMSLLLPVNVAGQISSKDYSIN